jgi:MbtH protein
VVNHEDSIPSVLRSERIRWAGTMQVRAGKQECLAYIKEVWTDMRLLSLRKKMEEMAKEAR